MYGPGGGILGLLVLIADVWALIKFFKAAPTPGKRCCGW